MAHKYAQCLLYESSKHLINKGRRSMHFRFLSYHCSEASHEEEPLPSEWYENAFMKLTKLANLLKDVDLIDGRMVNVSDNSRVYDSKLQEKMYTFKSLARAFIGSPVLQEAMRKNLMATFPNSECALPMCFSKSSERQSITVNSLAKISDFFDLSAQQRRLVRVTICPQVTQHQIWIGALEEILNGLRLEIEHLIQVSPSKDIKMAKQIVVSCMKFLDTAVSYDPESTSWMRLAPSKVASSDATRKWEDVLEMFIDLTNCLSDEKGLVLHVTKLEVMKEGLYQIRDVLIDKKIGYKETRYQENLVQKKLTKTLGHSSKCLFTLLLYYLYGSIRDIEVEMRGGIYPIAGKNQFCLCVGKFMTSNGENAVWGAVKQLDRALRLFKFVWETANLEGNLKLQGHLWCIGDQNRSFTYRGNTFLLHGIS